jgi:hypothetical protein
MVIGWWWLLLLIVISCVVRLAATLLKLFVYNTTFVACRVFAVAERAFCRQFR